MAKPTPLKVTITLSQADAIADEALRLARQHDLQPLTVVVLDTGGHQIVAKREDGCGIMRVQVATAKAYGALGMGISSRELGEHVAGRELFGSSLSVISGGRFATVPGGVLVRDADGSVIGAVGITGDKSPADEFAAIGGIRSVGLESDPAEPASGWTL